MGDEMSEANLVVRITPQGFLEVVRGLQEVQRAVKSVDVTESEWLAAKDRRAKELAAIAKAEMRATEERLRQERAALAASAAQERSIATQRTQDLKTLLQARTAHDRTVAASALQAARDERQAAQQAAQARKAELAELEAVGRRELAQRAQRAREERATLDLMLRARDNYERGVVASERRLAQAERQAERERKSARAAELRDLEASGRREIALQEQRTRAAQASAQAASRQRGMEWTAQAQGGYGPQMIQAKPVDTDWLNPTISQFSMLAMGINQSIALVSQLGSAIGGFVKEAAKWESMDMALNLMEGSAKGAAKATADLYQIAKAPAIDLETAQRAYIQLRAMHIAGTDAKRIIVDISNTIGRAGGGSQQFERTMLQLKDMIATGVVYQKDLKLMKEAMPELGSLMESAFGTPTAEGIRKMHVNSVQFLQGILTEMEKLPKPIQTLTSSMENFETALSRAKAAFVNTDFSKRVIDSFTTMLESMTQVLQAKTVNWGSLIWGVISGQGVKHGAYASGKEKDIAEVNSFFDSREAKLKISGFYTDKNSYNAAAKQWNEKPGSLPSKPQLREVKDSAGKTRDDWMSYLDKKWANESQVPAAPNSKTLDELAKTAGNGTGSEKEKRDPVAEARKRLDALINANTLEVAIRKNANDKMNELQEQGIDQSIINAIVERDRTVEEVSKKYKTIADLGYASEAQKKKLTDLQIAETLEATRKGNEKIELAEKEWTAKEDAKTRAANEKARKDDEAYWKDQQDKADKAKGLYLTELERIQKEYDDKHRIIVEATLLTETERTKIEKAALAERLNQENAYHAAKLNLFFTGSSDMFAALAETRKGMTSEANDTYQVLFGISKTFAIAKASVDLASAVLSVYSDPENVTFEMKMARAGMVMAAGGALLGQINSTVFSGVFDKGGYIPRGGFGIAGENGPEIIQGPAHVTSTRDTARMLAGVSGGSQPVVNIHNYAGASVTTSKNADGSLDVLIQQVAASVEKKIAGGIATGSSPVAGAIQGAYGVRR